MARKLITLRIPEELEAVLPPPSWQSRNRSAKGAGARSRWIVEAIREKAERERTERAVRAMMER